jgi:hypothetical protein
MLWASARTRCPARGGGRPGFYSWAPSNERVSSASRRVKSRCGPLHGRGTTVGRAATCGRRHDQWRKAVRASDEWKSSAWHRPRAHPASRTGTPRVALGLPDAGRPRRAIRRSMRRPTWPGVARRGRHRLKLTYPCLNGSN